MLLSRAASQSSQGCHALCAYCGCTLAHRQRSSKRFCSERCKKAAARAAAKETGGELIAELKVRRLIGPVWPVYRWDASPLVFGLVYPRQMVLEELNADRAMPLSDSELVRAFKTHQVADWGEPIEARLIADFHSSRRARRVARQEALSGTKIGDEVE